ncbi:MAG: SpoIIE family protein phosphatase [Bryobacteraceae bacterium]
MKKPTWQYAILSALLAWALIAQLTYSVFLIYTQANSAKYPAPPFEAQGFTARIVRAHSEYRNSGLKPGDEVLAVNGEPVQGAIQLDNIPYKFRVGETIIITVRRSVRGVPNIVTVPVHLRADQTQGLDWAIDLGLFTIFPLSCLALGFFIAFARPRDPLAWITLAMLVSFSQLASGGGFWAIWPPWREIYLAYFAVLSPFWSLWFLIFGLYFPAPFAFLRTRQWISWLLAAPILLLVSTTFYGRWMEGSHVHDLVWLSDVLQRMESWITLLVSLYIAGFFVALAFKKATLREPDAKRRLDVMRFGCSLALGPLLLLVLSQMHILPNLPIWLETICLLMLLFFPITMAYVIVVQRAMDVRMVVRTGVKYTLASTGFRILRIALFVVIAALTTEFGIRSGGRWEAAIIACFGAALMIGFRRIAVKVSQWMDRRFFREAYKTEVILTDLSNSVAGIRDREALLETVTRRIADSLHVPRIAVLLEQGNRYEPAYALGFDGSGLRVELKENTATIRMLRQERAPSKIYFDDPQSWVHGTSADEQTALQTLGAQILLPVTLENRMLGLISLGPKRSEAPYSKMDLQLLSAVASQTGLALENAELTETIRHEIAQRERSERELEIAREVQQRLFPQKLPEVKGLDFAGYCRPALGVGGDYYDFIRLPDDCLGIAIGDVSGKGIAAALMMASLQASLRGQTIRPAATLGEMIQLINRLVYEASAENRYATFFYAQYDSRNRLLRYVNAGHNPPILRRKREDGNDIVRLDEGGTVLGLFPDFPYAEARIQLEPGDLLVAFTDGISEAMTAADEEFDEERLIDSTRECATRCAADMITCILDRVDTFTAGAPQHDDMTLLVVRVQ